MYVNDQDVLAMCSLTDKDWITRVTVGSCLYTKSDRSERLATRELLSLDEQTNPRQPARM